MKPTISDSSLVLVAMFLVVVICFLIAMAFGTPFAVEQINQLFTNAGFDFELPFPSQFQK